LFGYTGKKYKSGRHVSKLSLLLLGKPQACLDQRPIEFQTRRALGLLLYLAVEGGEHSREKLTVLFWPESDAERGRSSLRRTLAYLRGALGGETYIRARRDSLAFDRAADFEMDVEALESAWSMARTATGQPREGPGGLHNARHDLIARLQSVVNTYCGDFFEGFTLESSPDFDDWVSIQRQTWHRRMDKIFDRLSELQAENNDTAGAIETVARWLAHHSLNEAAYRRMMLLRLSVGDRTGALRAYEDCQAILERELGVAPGEEIQELYWQIKTELYRSEREISSSAIPRSRICSLPTYLSVFLGRDRELKAIAGLLEDPDCRMLSLVGPGGIGKTRLAVQAAEKMSGRFAQGCAFVSLAGITGADGLASVISNAINLPLNGHTDTRAQLFHYFQDKHLLLVLDNYEQLLADRRSVDFIRELLGQTRQLKLMVTSRETLELQGEWVFEVRGLEDEAEALFLHSARRARAGFEAAPQDRETIAKICRMLGKIPLAIELAASWVRVLECAEITGELEKGNSLLTSTSRDLPERHRSMTAVLDDSWALLSEDEQHVMERLSVFRGGFTRQEAEYVAGVTLAELSVLAAKSMLRRGEAGRYALNELVQRYAARRLQADPVEYPIICGRYSDFFVRLLDGQNDRTNARLGDQV
jgi:predicted ATPase/DNA-binding SARP family transcriptional activator